MPPTTRKRSALKEISEVVLNSGAVDQLESPISANCKALEVDGRGQDELIKTSTQVPSADVVGKTDDHGSRKPPSAVRKPKARKQDKVAAVTSTPASKGAYRPTERGTPSPSSESAPSAFQELVGQATAARSSRHSTSCGRLEFPVSPIASSSSRSSAPAGVSSTGTTNSPPLSSPPDWHLMQVSSRAAYGSPDDQTDSETCGRFDRSRSGRSYARTPRKRSTSRWTLMTGKNLDDDHRQHNAEDDESDATIVKEDTVDPYGFLVLDESSSKPSLATSTRPRATGRLHGSAVKRSPLEGGCYSPPSTVVKRKRPQKMKEQPVWDEARYSHMFDEINREFEEVERTELCVVFEDQSMGGHGHVHG